MFHKNDIAIVYKFNDVFKRIVHCFSGTIQQGTVEKFYYFFKKSAALNVVNWNFRIYAI